MPLNLEVKVRIESPEFAQRIARSLGGRLQPVLYHVDTYVDVSEGRLKLREFRGRTAELIYYDRASVKGAAGRWSSYVIYPVAEPRGLRKNLASKYGIVAIVRKRRKVFLLQNARIHIDVVKGLGAFLEFEVIQSRGPAQAGQLFRRLRKAFGIRGSATIGGSYSELVAKPLRRKG